jgi:hypothetical protein
MRREKSLSLAGNRTTISRSSRLQLGTIPIKISLYAHTRIQKKKNTTQCVSLFESKSTLLHNVCAEMFRSTDTRHRQMARYGRVVVTRKIRAEGDRMERDVHYTTSIMDSTHRQEEF